MRHGEGWRWIQIGRFIERAQQMCRLLDLYYGAMPTELTDVLRTPRVHDWECLLDKCAAFEAYSKEYTANIRPSPIAEFLIFDAEFPRSVRYAVDVVEAQLKMIADGSPLKTRGRAERMAGRLKAKLDFGQLEEVMSSSVHGFLTDIQKDCQQIHSAIFESYISYPLDAHLSA